MTSPDHLTRRVNDWLEAPILGHGLWARYQDARTLIPELLDRIEEAREIIEELNGVDGWMQDTGRTRAWLASLGASIDREGKE